MLYLQHLKFSTITANVLVTGLCSFKMGSMVELAEALCAYIMVCILDFTDTHKSKFVTSGRISFHYVAPSAVA